MIGYYTRTGTCASNNDNNSGTAYSTNYFYDEDDWETTSTGDSQVEKKEEIKKVSYDIIWSMIWHIIVLRRIIEYKARGPPKIE